MDGAHQIVIVWIAAVVFFAIVVTRMVTKKRVPTQQRIDDWARKAGVCVVSAQRRYFFKGPFFFYRHAVVYRIRVRDGNEAMRDGWLRIGFSLFGDDFEDIRWEERA
ncbi:MAG TPA: hypothetical protein PLB90_12010 [Opitutaceae bacterium]|nr:hypothetical protein [Opitutaceae bacterium]